MIIEKDSRNCLFNAAEPVTDTVWLKPCEEETGGAAAFELSLALPKLALHRKHRTL